MVTISRDNPCFSITSVAHGLLPVFRRDTLKQIVCAALDEARHSGQFAIFAYVIMPDHLHVITSGPLKPSDTLRFCWSSGRCWKGWPREDEPLLPDLDEIVWRRPR